MKLKNLLALFFILLCCPASARFPHGSAPTGVWSQIKVGNGGVLIRFDMANDGTKVTGTDSFGCYVWSDSADQWQQLLTDVGIGSTAPVTALALGSGCDDIIVDHANGNNLWVFYGGNLYKSINKGVTFSATNFPVQPTDLTSISNSAKNYAPYIAVDPHNSNVVYVSTGSQGLFLTTDGGTTFNIVTALSGGLPQVQITGAISTAGTNGTDSIVLGTGTKAFNHNSSPFAFSVGDYVKVWQTSNVANQMFGQVSASSGITFSLNATVSWGSVTATDWTVSPVIKKDSNVGGTGGGHRIVFDDSGLHNCGAGSNQTCNIFVHTYGVNTWKSADAGSTWTPVNATNKPATIRQMRVDPFGVLWVLNDSYKASPVTNIDKLDGATWTVGMGQAFGVLTYTGIGVDPLNCTTKILCHVLAIAGGNNNLINFTQDGGSNWAQTGSLTYASSAAAGVDVDWHVNYLTASATNVFNNAVVFDTVTSGKVWAPGEGVFYFNVSSPAAWSEQTRGIEEFVSIKAITTPSTSGAVMLTSWDFPCFYSSNFNVYPSAISCKPGNAQTNVERGYSIDWVWNASATVANLVMDGTGSSNSAGLNFSGISTTSGTTSASWTPFTSQVTQGQAGGCIAMKDSTHMVQATTASGGLPQFTTNGGTSWASITVAGGTPTSQWGPAQNFTPASKVCESDKANGDIYMYNTNINSAGPDGFYKSTDGGANFTLQAVTPTLFTGEFRFNEQLKSVGVAGNLFFTGGNQGSPFPQNALWYYTTDGWATAHSVTGFKQVMSFDSGATWPTKAYPGLYAQGWFTGTCIINGASTSCTDEYGLWMCKEFNTGTGACNTTWARLGTRYPLGILSLVTDVAADKVVPGKVYVWTNGGAFAIQGSYLLKRDLDPVSNDNDPMWISKTA